MIFNNYSKAISEFILRVQRSAKREELIGEVEAKVYGAVKGNSHHSIFSTLIFYGVTLCDEQDSSLEFAGRTGPTR